MKTGWTESAGYCLIGSAKVGDMRLVAVVLGSEDNKRFNDVASLINYGFRYFVTERKVRSNESLKKLKVVGGVDDEVSLGVVEDVVITLQKDQQGSLRYEIEAPKSILAPVFAGDVAGKIKAYDDENNLVIEQELVYLESVESVSPCTITYGCSTHKHPLWPALLDTTVGAVKPIPAASATEYRGARSDHAYRCAHRGNSAST